MEKHTEKEYDELLRALQKSISLLVLTYGALYEHMELIKDQATKNSKKGDEYWAVYSQGVFALLECTKFVSVTNNCINKEPY